jgi:YggT family protein
VLVLAEGAYSVTDPPLKALRKVIPSLTFGGMRIDFAFLALMIITSVLLNLGP